MVKEIKGNLFDSKADVLCHQVNTFGVMGAGIAREVKKRFPEVYKKYKDFCDSAPFDEVLHGDALIVGTDERNKQFIANCFGQVGWETNYEILEQSLGCVANWMAEHWKKTVAVPCRMSCGLAGGDWNIVKCIIMKVFENFDLEIWEL